MKKIVILMVLLAEGVKPGYADVDSLTIRYGGGCTSDNSTGSCTIRVMAQGTDLDGEGLWIYTGKDQESLTRLSPRVRPLNADGSATYRVKNVSGGCYRVRTSPNGNEKPDRLSNILCER
jgi:hypothetical protein